MDFLYRNKTSVPITVDLGGEKKVILPGSTLLVPEKYDYLIAKRKVLLERDYEETIELDMIKNPEEWKIPTIEETLQRLEKELAPKTETPPEPKKSGRKKKKVTE